MNGLAYFTRVLCFGVIVFSSICLSMAQAHEVRVVVESVESTDGQIYVAVFKDGSMKFLDEHKVDATSVTPKIGSVEVTFSLPSANYVFVAFQDQNDNLVMDTNWIGYPKEPYAISNNHLIPSYKASEVEIQGDTTVTLKLKGD